MLLQVLAGAEPPFDTQLDSFSAHFDEEFWTLCWKLNTPCGMEYPGPEQVIPNSSRPKMELKKTDARHVLNEIVRRHPAYRWATRKGVLNFEPATRSGEDFLARKLKIVSIHGKTSEAALDVLHQAPSTVAWMPNGRVYSPGNYALVDIELRNVSVRDALNAIAKLDGKVLWSFMPPIDEKAGGSFGMDTWR